MSIRKPCVAVMLLAACSATAAVDLLECRDPRLASMEIEQLRAALEDAGGRECRVRQHAWARTVDCERVVGLLAYGLPVRELSAELTNNGTRSLTVVSTAAEPRARRALEGHSAASPLELRLQTRDDGVASFRCLAEALAQGGSAYTGSLGGTLPALPVGAHGWQVCAQVVSGGERHCIELAGQSDFRIDALAPGEYDLQATPLGATDRLLRAIPSRGQVGSHPNGDPIVLGRQFSVRAGAKTEVAGMELLRLPLPPD